MSLIFFLTISFPMHSSIVDFDYSPKLASIFCRQLQNQFSSHHTLFPITVQGKINSSLNRLPSCVQLLTRKDCYWVETTREDMALVHIMVNPEATAAFLPFLYKNSHKWPCPFWLLFFGINFSTHTNL